jgi:hypothetical protein
MPSGLPTRPNLNPPPPFEEAFRDAAVGAVANLCATVIGGPPAKLEEASPLGKEPMSMGKARCEPVDAAGAVALLRAAAKKNPAASWLLGEALEQGEGVEVDIEAAIDCFRAAALAGFAPAHEALARHGVYLPPPRREPEPVVGHVPDANRFLTRIEPFATTYNSPRAFAP